MENEKTRVLVDNSNSQVIEVIEIDQIEVSEMGQPKIIDPSSHEALRVAF